MSHRTQLRREQVHMTPHPPAAPASLSDPPALTVMHPGQGTTGWLGTVGVQFKLLGTQTNGTVSVVEHPFHVGSLVIPHMHTLEDEYSVVTEGEIGFRSGTRQDVLCTGGSITKPRITHHSTRIYYLQLAILN